MISMQSAGMSNRGDSLSSSDVILANGAATDGVDAMVEVALELALRLWTVPFLKRGKDR